MEEDEKSPMDLGDIQLGDTQPAAFPATPFEWPKGERLAILLPTNRNPELELLSFFSAIFERDKMVFVPSRMNYLIRNRNQLAETFLYGTNCPWSLWLDDDAVPPWGDVQAFRNLVHNPNFPEDFIKLNVIYRLVGSGKKFIGGCYFGRHPGGRAQYAEAIASNISDQAAHAGPRNLIQATNWIGMGGPTLVHRSVYEDIMRTQPEGNIQNPALARLLGYRYKFFSQTAADTDESENSEDKNFCVRATRAGHQIFVDHAVMPAHVGRMGFSFLNTRRPNLAML
jgi:hypothetical protein